MNTRIQCVHDVYFVLDKELKRGGVGSIHPTTDDRFVYKRYIDRSKAPKREDLERLVHIGRSVLIGQGIGLGEMPRSSINWPIDFHLDRHGVAGAVLPRIPQALYNEYGVRTLDFLVLKRGTPPGAKQRVILLLRMAEILAFVDQMGLVHGDINSKNLAWSVAGVPGRDEPVMYLIDCDGMVPQAPAPAVGVSANGWRDPRLVEGRIRSHDQFSDRYALALAVYRGLLLVPGNLDKNPDGRWPSPSQIPSTLPIEVREPLRRALSNPLRKEARPDAASWVASLIAAFIPGGTFDERAIQELDRAAKVVTTTRSDATNSNRNEPVRKPTVPPPAPKAPTPKLVGTTTRPAQRPVPPTAPPTPVRPVRPAPQTPPPRPQWQAPQRPMPLAPPPPPAQWQAPQRPLPVAPKKHHRGGFRRAMLVVLLLVLLVGGGTVAASLLLPVEVGAAYAGHWEGNLTSTASTKQKEVLVLDIPGGEHKRSVASVWFSTPNVNDCYGGLAVWRANASKLVLHKEMLSETSGAETSCEGLDSIQLTEVAADKLSIRLLTADGDTTFQGQVVRSSKALAPIPKSLIGSWTGSVKQDDGRYGVRVRVTSGRVGSLVGKSTYPDQGCSGDLKLLRVSKGAAYVEETITEKGFKPCLPVVLIRLQSSKAGLTYSSVKKDWFKGTLKPAK